MNQAWGTCLVTNTHLLWARRQAAFSGTTSVASGPQGRTEQVFNTPDINSTLVSTFHFHLPQTPLLCRGSATRYSELASPDLIRVLPRTSSINLGLSSDLRASASAPVEWDNLHHPLHRAILRLGHKDACQLLTQGGAMKH